MRNNAYEVVIVRPEKWSGGVIPQLFVHGNVHMLAIKDHYIAGSTKVLRGDLDRDARAKAGFFILNTDTDQLREGLTEDQWHEVLKSIGWSDPHLTKPP